MTSEDWMSASNPHILLEPLAEQANARRVQLFACACFARAARLLEHPLVKPDPKGDAQHLQAWVSEALRVCTNHADGNSSDGDFEGPHVTAFLAENVTARFEAGKVGELHHLIALAMRWLVQTASPDSLVDSAIGCAAAAAETFGAWAVLQRNSEEGRDRDEIRRSATEAEEQVQAELVREVLGNPFAPVSVEPGWQTPLVVTMARSIYEENDFPSLPILADALEEAGCTDPVLLAHCRAAGPHVRGSWVLDLLASDDFRPRAIPKPDPWSRLSQEQRLWLIKMQSEALFPPGVPVNDGRYPAGVVRRVRLDPLDIVRLAMSQHQARLRRNACLTLGGMFAALGLLAALASSLMGLVLPGGLAVCFALLAVEQHNAGKDSNASEKEIIQGVIEARRTEITLLGTRFVLHISGVDVVVPTDSFEKFHKGETVRAERTSNTGEFLSLMATSEGADATPQDRTVY